MNDLAVRGVNDVAVRDVTSDFPAQTAAIQLSGEPLAFRVMLGDVSRDAILVSEASSGLRRVLPAPYTIPSLARLSRMLQVAGREVILEYGIYRLR